MIRNLRESDLRDVEEIYEKSNNAVFLNAPNGFFKKDRKKFSSYTIRHCRNLVFEENGRVSGVISFSEDYIEGLFVLPEFWNRGIGSALLDSAVSGGKEVRLQVYADNPRAVEFYRKRGFRAAGSGVCRMTGLKYIEMERCSGRPEEVL